MLVDTVHWIVSSGQCPVDSTLELCWKANETGEPDCLSGLLTIGLFGHMWQILFHKHYLYTAVYSVDLESRCSNVASTLWKAFGKPTESTEIFSLFVLRLQQFSRQQCSPRACRCLKENIWNAQTEMFKLKRSVCNVWNLGTLSGLMCCRPAVCINRWKKMLGQNAVWWGFWMCKPAIAARNSECQAIVFQRKIFWFERSRLARWWSAGALGLYPKIRVFKLPTRKSLKVIRSLLNWFQDQCKSESKNCLTLSFSIGIMSIQTEKVPPAKAITWLIDSLCKCSSRWKS